MAENTLSSKAIQDYAAERAVLGGILADKRKIADVATLVRRDDFFYEPHGEIFDACVQLDLNNKPVDPITLAEELKTRGTLGQVGGVAYLAELDTAAPTAANATEYARIVADKALRRRLLDASRGLVDLTGKEEGTIEELLDEAQRRIFAIGEERVSGEPRRINDVMEKTLELLDKLRATRGGITGLATGFFDLDKQLTGLHAGELIILAARPGVGKTSLALNMGVHAAVREKQGVAVFSLEMPADQLALRLLSSEAKVSLKRLREGGLSDHDMSKINTAAAELYNAPVYIDDSGHLTAFDLRAKARRLKQKDKSISLIIIDYLQLMSGGGRSDSREQEVAQISRALKQLAKELSLPIIALSQLNRKVEERKDGRPMLSDLRESGCLAGDTRVALADGTRTPIRELAGRSGFQVWALDEASYRLVPATVSRAFSTGVKPVFRLTTRLGRTIRATANHKFRTPAGWVRLDELQVGDRLALPVQEDIAWNELTAVEPDGEEEVFDLTVPGPHNFVAGDIVVHNSIEQDADVVMFIHPEPDEEGSAAPGALPISLIVAKQRNGPTGDVPLVLLQEYTKFENRARGEEA